MRNRLAAGIGLAAVGLYFIKCALSPATFHFIDSANLIFHEAGHTIFFFAGEFVRIFMGSGFQVLLPLLIALYFFATRQKISGSVALAWAGQSLLNVSVYANDALDMKLDLLGGDSVIHDWNYILGATGTLSHTHEIASGMYIAGMALVFAGVFLSGWYFLRAEKAD